MKELKLKSAFDGMNSGICSVCVDLTNGCSSNEINVTGVDSKMAGSLKMPRDHTVVKQAIAYADDQGVFNIYLMDKEGNTVCHYDPKNYGKPKYGQKYTFESHEEIIGVYGSHPGAGGEIFSSFGFVLLSSTRYREGE